MARPKLDEGELNRRVNAFLRHRERSSSDNEAISTAAAELGLSASSMQAAVTEKKKRKEIPPRSNGKIPEKKDVETEDNPVRITYLTAEKRAAAAFEVLGEAFLEAAKILRRDIMKEEV